MNHTPLMNGKDEPVKLAVSDEALKVLAMTPPKGKRNRLTRIRQNLLRELEALNKEIRRRPDPFQARPKTSYKQWLQARKDTK